MPQSRMGCGRGGTARKAPRRTNWKGWLNGTTNSSVLPDCKKWWTFIGIVYTRRGGQCDFWRGPPRGLSIWASSTLLNDQYHLRPVQRSHAVVGQ